MPTDITYSDGTHAIGYAYNPAGQRTGITDASGSRTLDYDPDGRILSVTEPGASASFTYKYNSVGEITSRAFPDGDATTYAWSNGVQTSQTDSGSTVSYNYDPAGRLLSAKMPAANGYTESRTYDAAGNLATVGTAKTGSTLSAWTINRDEDNRPTSIIATRTGQATTTKSYTYDLTGRVLTEACTAASASRDCPGGSQNTAWTYDKVGNRQTQTTGGTTTGYHYNNLDQLTSSTVGGTTTDYGYDLDGNLTSDGTSTYTYDAVNHLDGVTTNGTATTFTLDNQGNRTAVTTGGNTQKLVWDINNPLPQLAYQTRPSGNLGDYHYDPTGVPQSIKTSSGSLFLAHDGMGSITDLIDQNGTPQAQYTYTAFGIESSAGTSIPAAIAANPFGFTGQLNDSAVNGDQDLRARDYNPATGRFTGRDAIDLRVNDPYVSAYAYANDASTYMSDPSRLCAQDDPSVDGFNETLKKAMDTTRHNWARDMVASYLQGKYAGSGGSVWTEFFMPYPSKERADDAYFNVQQKLLKFWEIKFVNQSTEAGGPADLARYINQFRQRYPSLRVMAGENIPQLTRPDPFSPEKLSLVAESSLTRSGGPRDPRFQGVVAWWTRLRNDARDRTNPAQPEGWSMVDTSWERAMQTTEDYTSDAADSSAVDKQWVSDIITQGVGDAMKTAHLDTMYAEALGLAWGAGTGGPAGSAGSLPAETIESSMADVIDITTAIAEYAALKMVA